MTVATEPSALVAQPRAKAKRPRPCFEDGSLTRAFKFPSKSFPRSTYYVTSSEIIIRIKKARKKWKLIVPKKRVVSYRTNRWFAKPRWIELELTFTQASRLGLIEARKKPLDVNSDGDVRTSAPAADAEPAALTPQQSDAQEQQNDDDASDFDLVLDLSDEVTESITLDEQHDSGAIGLPEFDAASDEPSPYVAQPAAALSALPATGPLDAGLIAPTEPRSQSRRSALIVAAMVLFLVFGAGLWLTFVPQPGSETAEIAQCPGTVVATSCTASTIVTGAAEAPRAAPVAMTKPTTPIVDTKPPEPVAPEPPRALAAVPDSRAAASETPSPRASEELVSAAVTAAENRPAPPVVVAMAQPAVPRPEPVDLPHCGALAAEARSMTIRFDYASPLVDRAVLAALSAFASRLRSCPLTMVTVEGHTDSDGHEERNETLSWRRAEAVIDVLMEAGVKPEQLSAIGYGQTQPYLPNASPKNKRRNRRVVLLVDPRR